MLTRNPATIAAASNAQSQQTRTVWSLLICSAAFNLAGIGIVGMVQVALRLAGRNPLPLDTLTVCLYGLFTIVPLIGSAVAARRSHYGPAALLAAITVPVFLLAAFAALLALFYSLWCCITTPLLPAGMVLALALFLVSACMSVITAPAGLDVLRQHRYTGAEDDD
jgi:hypothetical protein